MKNSDKILFGVALLACIGGCAAYGLLAPAGNAKPAAKTAVRGADVEAWTDKSDGSVGVVAWKAPAFDLEEGWNYDLFSSPEISWDSKQKKYFAKELPPPPEEVFGLTLKSLEHPKFRLVINSYLAGKKPVPEKTPSGRYAAVLSLTDTSAGAARMLNFGLASTPPVTLSDETDAQGTRVVTFLPETPVTIGKSNAKLKSFSITQGKAASGAFYEKLSAVVIDESGRTPREFVVGTSPISDKNRIEAVFTDGFAEWLYSETRIPGRKEPVCEIAVRESAGAPFKFVETGREIKVGNDVFRIKGLDISAQQARIEKTSAELDKKTKAPKTTERVLAPEQ